MRKKAIGAGIALGTAAGMVGGSIFKSALPVGWIPLGWGLVLVGVCL